MKAEINLDYAYFNLVLFRSKIQGRGVKAGENIPARRVVMEHTGLLMNRRQYRKFVWENFDLLSAKDDKRKHQYVWRINDYWSMNGEFGGSGAQFVNHSCDPNLYVRFGGRRIYYYSRRAIKKGEELTISYGYNLGACRCGSKKCRGTIK